MRISDEVYTATNEILVFSDLLDEKWLKTLSNISDCITEIKVHLDLNGENSTLTHSAYFMWNLYAESKELELISNKYYTDHKEGNEEISPPGTFHPDGLVFEMEIIHNTGAANFP